MPKLQTSAARRVALAVLLVVSFVPAGAGAVDVPSLYSAEVPLDDAARDPRADAYRAALRQVLRKVSGAALAEDPATVDLLFPDPAAWVVQFRPAADDHIWVSFDGVAIENVLRRNGQTVWGSDRPLTLVWLAVDWGRGEREIVAAADDDESAGDARSIDRNRLLRERLLDAASRRGLPVAFPLLDSEELAAVSFADIWGGFDEPVLAASARYDARSVLIGRVRPGSSQRNRWSYYLGDEQRVWDGEPESVVGQLADILAAEFAVRGDAPRRVVTLRIGGVDSLDAYGEVYRQVAGLSIIDEAAITEARGDTLTFRVDMRGVPARLARALAVAGFIEQESTLPPADGFGSGPDVLEFFYNP